MRYSLGLDEGGLGVHYGTVEYWVRLRVPMAQALRLYKVSSFSEFVFFVFFLISCRINKHFAWIASKSGVLRIKGNVFT